METILVVVPIVIALGGIAVAMFFGGQTRRAPRHRPTEGTVHKFDTLSALVKFCRDRYRTDAVRTIWLGEELLLQVDRPGGRSFESPVQHGGGEESYAALLPDVTPPEKPAS